MMSDELNLNAQSVARGSSSILGYVITVSDRCAAKTADDISGPLAVSLLAEHGVTAQLACVPDDIAAIRTAIRRGIELGARIIFTTGGTGVSPRDVTPEATEPLLSITIPGLADAIRRRGEAHAPAAMLSRGLVGVTGRDASGVLIVNAPGSTGGVKDAVAVIGPIISHILDQLAGGDHARPVHKP